MLQLTAATLLTLLSATATAQGPTPADAIDTANGRTNVVVILADDLGIPDISLYDPERGVPTPHLEALADASVLMTAGYSTAAVCSPSRAGLMTGRYQQRDGFEYNAAPNADELELTLETIGNAHHHVVDQRARGARYGRGKT